MSASASWWQSLPSRIDPFIIEIGSFRLGWYGMMYVLAFATFYLLGAYRIKRDRLPYCLEMFQDYIVWAAFGLIIGARLGYVLIYNFGYYATHPLEIIMPFDITGSGVRFRGIAGMSYHGGLLGVIVMSLVFMRRRGEGFLLFAERFVPAIPLGYVFGRMGNFINGELYGRATDSAWGMYFPSDPTQALRHPSQLYEAFFEGVVLFAILWPLRNSKSMHGLMLPAYLTGYGLFRFMIEYLRQPDEQLGFVLIGLSMGQILCLAMVFAATGLAIWNKRMHRLPL